MSHTLVKHIYASFTCNTELTEITKKQFVKRIEKEIYFWEFSTLLDEKIEWSNLFFFELKQYLKKVALK
jgi:hypothetical protein